MKYRLHVAALSITLFFTYAQAQKPAPFPKTGGTAKPSGRKEGVEQAGDRQLLALSLLTSLADEARGFRDEILRARVQARVADVLWNYDRERARVLFRRAWEAAESFEAEQKRDDGTISRPGRLSNKPPTGRPRTNLRSEIIRLAARHDRVLGEEFLAQMTASKEQEAERAGVLSTDATAPALSQAAINERLRLAQEFLESGDPELALRFADPALIQITEGTIQFLVNLREKNSITADQRFTSLLSLAAADPSSDANTVSLLTSYAFTPSIFVVVSETGIPSSMRYAPRPAPDLEPALRASFFRVASAILLRPLAELDRSSVGRAGTYYIAARLLPLFQQHAPDLAPSISVQMAALSSDVPQTLIARNDPSLNRNITQEGQSDSDRIEEELEDRLSHAQNTGERDRAYAFAAMRAADAGDPRASEFVDKVEDMETRNGIRSFVDYKYIGGLLGKKNVEEAVLLARKKDLTHAQRVRILTQAAEILSKTDRARAIDLLEASLAEARRIDTGTPERAYALVAIGAQFSRLDRQRAWELASDTVKAANGVAGFTGENGQTSLSLEGKFSIRMSFGLASETDLPDCFAALAEDDLYRVIELAKNFTGEAPRALATLAIARSVLADKRGRPVR
jgi:hypothetical protein